jgi:hypothetical protein
VLPKKIWLTAAVVGVLACVALLPRKPSSYEGFWQAHDRERAWKNTFGKMSDVLSGRIRDEYEPPSDGIYLYLNEVLVVRQFQALMPPLGVTASKEMSATGRDIKFESGASKIGSVSASASALQEAELTKEAPPISPPFAAQQLIGRIKKLDDTVKLGPATGLFSSDVGRLTNELSRLGVQLTQEQLQKLEQADRENYRKEVLKADRAKAIMYWGPISVAQTDKGIVLTFDCKGPVTVMATGLLKSEGLGDHLSLAIQTPDVRLGAVTLYGVIETREQDGDTAKIVLTPYAIW